MRKKRSNGRTSTKTSVEEEIAHLRGLDLKGLRSRWQSVFQRLPPDHLPRHLLFAISAYRIQDDCFGDLDHDDEASAGSYRCEAIRYGNVGAAGQLRSEADRTYARNSPGSGVGSAIAACDGDGERLRLERPD